MTALLVFFDNLHCSAELSQTLSKIEAGLSASYDHDFLKVCVFASLMDFGIEIQYRAFFSHDVQTVVFHYTGVTVWDDDLAVPGYADYQHIGENGMDVVYMQSYQFRILVRIEFDEGRIAAGEYTVAECVFFSQELVYLKCYAEIGINYVIDIHSVLYERQLLHMFRVANPGDDFLAAEFLCECSDDDIRFIIASACHKEII